jgi:hypothetical protein
MIPFWGARRLGEKKICWWGAEEISGAGAGDAPAIRTYVALPVGTMRACE